MNHHVRTQIYVRLADNPHGIHASAYPAGLKARHVIARGEAPGLEFGHSEKRIGAASGKMSRDCQAAAARIMVS